METVLPIREKIMMVVLCAVLVVVASAGAAFGGTAYSSWKQCSNSYGSISGQTCISTASKNAFAYTYIKANSYMATGYAGGQAVGYKNGVSEARGTWTYNQSAMSSGATFPTYVVVSTPVGTTATVSSYGNMAIYSGGSGQYTTYSLYQSPNQTI